MNDKRTLRWHLTLAICLLPFHMPSAATATPSRGMIAFEERRWTDAMDAFLEDLRQNPADPQAHAYVVLITREMESQRQAVVRQHRLEMLGNASRHLDDHRADTAALQQAIIDATHSEKNAQENQWHARCEEARMERSAGRLLSANDLVLQVLAENSAFAEAQRELSELQSQIRRTLDAGVSASIAERYALEGFYAYGQADYAAALTAWEKVRILLQQNHPGADGERRVKGLHFSAYEKIAREHRDEERRIAELRTLFDGGLALYQQKHFSRSLDEFRKLAIKDPEYPQLGYYLVQAEAAAERERTERLGEEKRRDIDRALQTGLASLEKEQYKEAVRYFEKALAQDPSHPQARSYLAMAHAEMQKRHDPKAAQLHYEAGLIAYASGKLDEAMREWHLAIRMNPQHEKALHALSKVQKELALNSKEPSYETIP